ncbi:MAG TPA: RpoL/Rpb11 RNA polymerase subunit family protein [Patescibacteria group bacterium]|nr:RpoL/Rpb11 RNA polymerase subunit family protein [Patescibacteria group bacterium]
MKLNLVKDEMGRLEIEIGGEGHTLLNLLQSSLLENKDVEMAGYSKPHPLMDRSALFINVKARRDPKKVLIDSAADAKKKVEEFSTKFTKEIEKVKK